MSTSSQFRDLVADLAAAEPGKSGFVQLAAPLENLGATQIAGLLAGLLREVRDQGRLSRQIEGHVYLHRGQDFSVLLRFAGLRTGSSFYSANEYDAYLVNLSSATLQIPRLACPPRQEEAWDRPGPLRAVPPLRLASHGLHYEPAFAEVLDIDAATPQAPILIVHSPPRAHTTWTFDPVTLKPLQRISTDLNASRIQLLLELLSAMDTEGLEDVLEGLSESNLAGYLRWEAMKLLCRRAPQRSIAVLRRIADADPEPALREAAGATLGRLA